MPDRSVVHTQKLIGFRIEYPHRAGIGSEEHAIFGFRFQEGLFHSPPLTYIARRADAHRPATEFDSSRDHFDGNDLTVGCRVMAEHPNDLAFVVLFDDAFELCGVMAP